MAPKCFLPPLWFSCVIYLLLGLARLQAAETNPRPNILFAFADDWGRFASAYQDRAPHRGLNHWIATPTFDRVARQGVLFEHAFVTAPSCTPCRSSLLSGQYFWRTGQGAILQGARWDPSIPVFPLMLQEAGYHIGETYKVWSPGTPVDAPFGGGANAYESAGRRFNQFSQQVTRMMEQGKTQQEAKRELYNEVLANFEAFLADNEAGKPFCYWFGPTLVHRKWVKGSGKGLWGIDPDRFEGNMPPYLPDVPEVREDLADYFGEIQAFDTALGLMLDRLEALGLLDQTVVIISGDHGPPGFPDGKCNLYDFGTRVPLAIRWPGQPGGRRLEDFVNLMDLAPTLLEIAGLQVPSVMTGQSLVPQLRSTEEGWVDPSRNWVVTGRERHVASARAGHLPYPQRAIRTPDYLYVVNFKPERWPMGDPLHVSRLPHPDWETLSQQTFATFADMDASPTKAWIFEHREEPSANHWFERAFGKRPFAELYDLKQDPYQMENLAGRPALAATQGELHERLMSLLRENLDPRVTEDPVRFEDPPFAGHPTP